LEKLVNNPVVVIGMGEIGAVFAHIAAEQD